MPVVADPCLTEGLGADSVTHEPGILALRHAPWAYTAALATATGLKLDPASGFPYTDPVDGTIQVTASTAGRSFSGDPGTAGVSMLTGGTAYISGTLTNTLHRPLELLLVAGFDFRWVFTAYSAFTSNDSQYLAPIITTAINAAPADPGTDASAQTDAELFGGIVTAGFGGAVSYGGRRERVDRVGTLNPGDSVTAKLTLAFNRGSAGYSNGAYDIRIVYSAGFSIFGFPQPPA